MAANLKEVRTRIVSVKSTMQITKAMKMVSAAKLRRATDKIVQIRPYSNQLNSILSNIAKSLGGDVQLALAEEREVKNVLIVVVSGDKGLCGAFNSNVIKLARTFVQEKYPTLAASGNVELMYVGKKAADAFRTFNGAQHKDYMGIFGNLTFEAASEAAESIMTSFQEKKYDRVHVVYNMFKNAASQFASVEQFLPVSTAQSDDNQQAVDFIFQPDKQSILETLVPNIIKTQFFRYLLDSNASEHGARMTAMDKATDNANELLKDLSIMYNRARQAAITTELSEIVSGAAALSAE